MVLIGMVWLFFFNIVPMFGIVIAFEDYNPMSGLWHSDFVGMENFTYLFSMSDCKRVILIRWLSQLPNDSKYYCATGICTFIK